MNVSRAGSTVAIAGWGIGLTVAGLLAAAGAIAYLADYRGAATRNIVSVLEQRRRSRFLPSRPVTSQLVRQSRYAIGAAGLFMSLLLLALGVFDLTGL